jgi:hypothetical protein
MRRSGLLMTAAFLGLVGGALAQGDRGKAEATVGGKSFSIDYGRPSLKGRDMLAKAPVGTVWRMGANKATTLEAGGDLVFGESTVPKGSYSLFAKRLDEKSWQLIFNSQTGQWGTQHDASLDVAAVPLSWEQQETSTEQFTIEISAGGDGGEIKMMWGTHVLKAGFGVK